MAHEDGATLLREKSKEEKVKEGNAAEKSTVYHHRCSRRHCDHMPTQRLHPHSFEKKAPGKDSCTPFSGREGWGQVAKPVSSTASARIFFFRFFRPAVLASWAIW